MSTLETAGGNDRCTFEPASSTPSNRTPCGECRQDVELLKSPEQGLQPKDVNQYNARESHRNKRRLDKLLVSMKKMTTWEQQSRRR